MTREPSNVLHGGVATFYGLPHSESDDIEGARCVLAGVPWDEGNAGRNGANYGPRAFRDASGWFLSYDAQRDFDLWSGLPSVDGGDVRVVPADAGTTMSNIAGHVESIRGQGALPVLIGGNHSITIGATRGAASTLDGSMGYLCIDAHLDTAPELLGAKYSSGCPTYRVCELDNVSPSNVVVFGVHGWLNPRSQVASANEIGISWYGMDKIEEHGWRPLLEEALAKVTDGVDGFYVSFDQDSIDASCFPGTGTPEPAGFEAREACALARRLGEARPVAFDAVELAPVYDPSGISARLSCGLVLAFLSGWVSRG